MTELTTFREQLNALDEQIVGLIAERMEICRQVAHYKKENEIPMMQPGRVEQVKERCAELASQRNVSGEFMRNLYALIIDETCRVEDEIIDEGRCSAGPA